MNLGSPLIACHGHLLSACPDPEVGLFFSFPSFQNGHWHFYSVASLLNGAGGHLSSAYPVTWGGLSAARSLEPGHLHFVSQLHPHKGLGQSSWTSGSQEIRMLAQMSTRLRSQGS